MAKKNQQDEIFNNDMLDEDIIVGEDGKVTITANALPEAEEGAVINLTDLKSGDGVNYSLTFDEDIPQDSMFNKFVNWFRINND